jgi:hypothetical protein
MSRIKSRDNRDKRVELLQKYARTHFPNVKYMEYAVTVETYTLTKANNLVLNVDGCIGSLFLDLLSSCQMFTPQEITEIIEIGYLNGLFVLARSIGLIGYVEHSRTVSRVSSLVFTCIYPISTSVLMYARVFLQAHFRSEAFEAAFVPPPVGGCSVHKVRIELEQVPESYQGF